MTEPPKPLDETTRLLNLHSLRILDTPSEERFDRITRLARRTFDVEICLVSFVDANRQWFKSKQGLDACETSREISFCGHAILDDQVLVVSDARIDHRFADNPLVVASPGIRFYAGAPIRGPHGYRVGTLCLIDKSPRGFSKEDQEVLQDFAAIVEAELAVSAQVTVDDLTQVANRRGFKMVASHILALCRRTETDAELLFFDLNGFKQINDSHGHSAGDMILRHFARLLVKCFRSADVVARLGGDEFVVLLAACRDSTDVALSRLEDMASDEPCEVKQLLSWSMGRVRFDPQRHETIDCLLAEADSRMYEEKVQSRPESR